MPPHARPDQWTAHSAPVYLPEPRTVDLGAPAGPGPGAAAEVTEPETIDLAVPHPRRDDLAPGDGQPRDERPGDERPGDERTGDERTGDGRPGRQGAGGARRGARLATAAIGLAVLLAGGAVAVTPRWPAPIAHWTGGQRTGAAHARTAGQPAPGPAGLPAAYTVPGTPPPLPWPGTGQATLRVLGVGSLGATPGQRPVPIASLSKVMTAYVVLRDHPLSAGAGGPALTVTAAEAAAYPEEVARDESLVKVTAGEVLTERQALDALMLPSADNVALILARWDAGDVPGFLDKMNATAAGLGMTSTHYTDPSGLAPSTLSTAADQTLLAAAAMEIPAFAQVVAQRSATVPVAGTVPNYNGLIGSDGVDGIKTGSTSAAGGCLLFAARYRVGGQILTILGAVLGQHGRSEYGLPLALNASRSLIEAAEHALVAYPLIPAGRTVATVGDVNLTAAATVTVVGWPGLTLRTRLHAPADPVPGADAGTLELVGPETDQTVPLSASRPAS